MKINLITKIIIAFCLQQYSVIIVDSSSNKGNINVTIRKSIPDPSIVRVKSNFKVSEKKSSDAWLVFASLQGIKVYSSSYDFSKWHVNGSCFPSGIDWVRAYTYNADNSSIGAPHVTNQRGQYWLLYSTRVPDVIMNFSVVAAIGVATSKTGLPGTWHDKGLVIASNSSTPFVAFYPSLFVDPSTKRWWMLTSGRFFGIWMVELEPHTGRLKCGAVPKQIAVRSNSTGIYYSARLFKRGNFYYVLFTNAIFYNGTYVSTSISVGRASSADGKYLDKNGKSLLMQDGHTDINGLKQFAWHTSVYEDPISTQTILLYNGGDYDLHIKTLEWDKQGWPISF